MGLELADCENTLLREIADKGITRRGVAVTYRLALRSSECDTIDWRKVNRAIIERWSLHALEWIKRKAWKGEL